MNFICDICFKFIYPLQVYSLSKFCVFVTWIWPKTFYCPSLFVLSIYFWYHSNLRGFSGLFPNWLVLPPRVGAKRVFDQSLLQLIFFCRKVFGNVFTTMLVMVDLVSICFDHRKNCKSFLTLYFTLSFLKWLVLPHITLFIFCRQRLIKHIPIVCNYKKCSNINTAIF